MSANPTAKFVTVEEYLEQESKAEFKSEYLNGQVFPMFGGTPRHALIVGNVAREIGQQLKGKPCRAYASSLMVRVMSTGLYTYPDVTVICGELQFAQGRTDVVTNPLLIVEVLSPSTEDYDRGRKFQNYRTLPTLIDYLTIAQDKPHVEYWTRQAENRWLLVEFADLGQSIELPLINCVLPLAEIYDKIEWQTSTIEPDAQVV